MPEKLALEPKINPKLKVQFSALQSSHSSVVAIFFMCSETSPWQSKEIPGTFGGEFAEAK